MSSLFTIHEVIILFLLIGLELILGIDNILIISLLVAPLEPLTRQRARIIGLLLALLFRLGFVSIAFWLVRLTSPILFNLSVRDIVLILGGLFLTAKTLKELYAIVQVKESTPKILPTQTTLTSIVFQILMLDIIFSVDSVITAVGLTSHLLVVCIAVVISFAALLFYIGPVGEFILAHLSLKILALCFLVLLGITFISEGFGYPIEKGYIYSGVGFALIVELIQKRCRQNRIGLKEQEEYATFNQH